MIDAVRILRESGANKIYAAFTHPVLADNAFDKLNAAFDDIISTDTIKSEVSKVKIAPLIETFVQTYAWSE